MKKFTKGNSRLLFSSTITTALFILMAFHSGQVQSQQVNVTSVTVSNPPATSCTNTILAISETHWAAGYVLNSSSFVVSLGGCCPTVASFTTLANNLSACVGETIVLNNTSVGSNGT